MWDSEAGQWIQDPTQPVPEEKPKRPRGRPPAPRPEQPIPAPAPSLEYPPAALPVVSADGVPALAEQHEQVALAAAAVGVNEPPPLLAELVEDVDE